MGKKSEAQLIWSWALYDWANSAFATTVMAGFFPLFFKAYWSEGFSATESTYVLGLANSIASLVIALTSPALGSVADEGSFRKRFLLFFTLIGAGSSVALAGLAKGHWLEAAVVYSIGVMGFTIALTFYDALLVHVTSADKFDRISGLGYGLGYLGGGLLFVVNVLMYQKPQWFGLADSTQGVLASFVSVGLWWVLFSIPLFAFVPEPMSSKNKNFLRAARDGFAGLVTHIRRLRHQRALLLFLAGYLFYIDGVNTIIKMAVDYGMSIGLQPSDLIGALLLVQFIGFPSAIAFGFLGERMGPKMGIWFCLVTYLGVTVYAYQIQNGAQFYFLAAIIGVVQGGIQSLSRSYYARLVPKNESAQYFGFFNMVGKFSSILGPVLVGATGLWLNNSRAGILVLSLFFVIGGFFLNRSSSENLEGKL